MGRSPVKINQYECVWAGRPLKLTIVSICGQVAQDNEIIFFFFSLQSLLCKTLRSFAS